ncbi:MliC family protein [Ursidibacter sp. B-7004-1]
MYLWKKAFSLLTTTVLLGCSTTTIAPAVQVEQQIQQPEQSVPQIKTDVVKKQRIISYQCAKNQTLRVQFLNSKKNSPITLTFNRSSYTLSPSVVTQGKKYSNIRWIWTEDFNGVGTLRDNRNNLLAEKCVKQS